MLFQRKANRIISSVYAIRVMSWNWNQYNTGYGKPLRSKGTVEIDYSRLDRTGLAHARLAELRALVVGAGALGNEVVKTLGLLGVGRITIVDSDSVESSNLTRSALFRPRDALGRNKAQVVVETVKRLFPDMEAEAFPSEIADVGLETVAGHQVLFSCVDNNLARVEIAYMSQRVSVPVIDGALGTSDYSHGRVSVFCGRGGACFCCLLSSARRRELLSLLDARSGSCWVASSGVGQIPSTPMMASIVGSMQVHFGLQVSLDRAVGGFACELTLAPEPRVETFSLRRSDGCPFHGAGELLPAPGRASEVTVRDLLSAAGWDGLAADALVLDWPVCVLARCATCNTSWSPMRRLALLRRKGACHHCGSARIVDEESIHSVMPGSRWFDRTLADLGMPENHLYTIRRSA